MSRRLFNYILSLFGINTEEQQTMETYHPEDDAILITQKPVTAAVKPLQQINRKSRNISKKKKKKKNSYLDWIPVDYLLSYIREQEMPSMEQPVNLSSDEDDGTMLSELKSLRNQVTKTCHALDTERPSAQFAETKNRILPILYEKLNQLSKYEEDVILFGYIMLGIESLNTIKEVRRQLFESDWSRTLTLSISSLLKNFNTKNTEEELIIVLLSEKDWLERLKYMTKEFERSDPHWQFKKEYQDVVEMADQLNLCVNK